MGRQKWEVTNTTKKTFSIGDLLKIPSFRPGETHDLLKWYDKARIEQSNDLLQLMRTGWLKLKKTNDYGTHARKTTLADEERTKEIATEVVEDSGGGSSADLDVVELELSFDLAKKSRYVEYTYSGDSLTTIDVYDTSAKTNKQFTKTLSYSGDQLASTVLTRTSDSATVTKSLSYSGDQLVNTDIAVS